MECRDGGHSGLAIALANGGVEPLTSHGCVILARALVAESRVRQGEPAADPLVWSRAEHEPAVAAWLADVRKASRAGQPDGAASAPRSLGAQLTAVLVANQPRTEEAELLLDMLGEIGCEAGIVGRVGRAVAEARLESVRELAYGAGHEINNPLANIAARAQSLLPDERDPERRRRLSTIVDQAFRARDMIGGLMVFARPPKPQPADVAVDAVVRPAFDALRPVAEARGVRFEYSPPPAPLAVRVDGTQVGEAIRLLAVNAFEAVDDGGRVLLEAAGDLERRRGRLVVADDGRGMDADVIRRSFDPFYSGRDAGRGIGLGLPKALRLIESNGGMLTVDSRPGQRTKVTVEHPLAIGG
ncbi:MAG: sensor histidine kinase, partial [Pirellulales bacterium]